MGACDSINSKKNNINKINNINNNDLNHLENKDKVNNEDLNHQENKDKVNNDNLNHSENKDIVNNNNFNFEDLPEVKEFLESKTVEIKDSKNDINTSINKTIINQSINKELVSSNILPVKYLEPKINTPIVDDNVKTLPIIYLNDEEVKNFNIDEILKRSQINNK